MIKIQLTLRGPGLWFPFCCSSLLNILNTFIVSGFVRNNSSVGLKINYITALIGTQHDWTPKGKRQTQTLLYNSDCAV